LCALQATETSDGYTLSGVKRHVAFASAADRLVVLARTGDGPEGVALFLVDPTAPGVTLDQQFTIASDTQYQVTFTDVAVSAADRIGTADWSTWDTVMHDGIILLAAQAIGGARFALEITTQYAKDREQFDKPLGAFQALAHYLADAKTAVDGGTLLTYEAAWARSEGREVARLAPMAKLFACQTYRDTTAMAQQIFGGVGFTPEYDIQLYFRRAKQLQVSWWNDRYLEETSPPSSLDGEPALTAGDPADGRATGARPASARRRPVAEEGVGIELRIRTRSAGACRGRAGPRTRSPRPLTEGRRGRTGRCRWRTEGGPWTGPAPGPGPGTGRRRTEPGSDDGAGRMVEACRLRRRDAGTRPPGRAEPGRAGRNWLLIALGSNTSSSGDGPTRRRRPGRPCPVRAGWRDDRRARGIDGWSRVLARSSGTSPSQPRRLPSDRASAPGPAPRGSLPIRRPVHPF
jgi:hypothetical protein